MTIRHSLLPGVAAAALLLVQPVTARAQDPDAGIGNHWSVSLFRFWTGGGPAGDFRTALTNQGLGDTIPPAGSFGGGVSPPVPTPTVRHGPTPGWAMAIAYRLTRYLDVEVNANRTVRMVEIGGFDVASYASLDLHTSIAAGGLTAGLRLGPVRLAAGPMYYRTRVQTEQYWHGGQHVLVEHDEDGAFGALLGAGFVLPVDSRFLVQGRAEFRWVGERSIGPFEAVAPSGDRVPFNPSQIGFNHGVLMLGIGFRP